MSRYSRIQQLVANLMDIVSIHVLEAEMQRGKRIALSGASLAEIWVHYQSNLGKEM